MRKSQKTGPVAIADTRPGQPEKSILIFYRTIYRFFNKNIELL